jgi:O-antigen/teichoic acid export membrane protein
MYEISFRVFSIGQILPIIISASLYPHLIGLNNSGDKLKLNKYYKKYFYLFGLYGLFMYTFIYSFADQIIPYVFGHAYSATPIYTKQMFLTLLLFPTAILQATMLNSMKLERVDMGINVISLIVSILSMIVGLSFSKSLSVINYSIFISFLVFHICQDAILLKKGITTLMNILQFYSVITIFILGYVLLAPKLSPPILFFTTWSLGIIVFMIAQKAQMNSKARALS